MKTVLKANDTKIDWESSASHYFFNPRHPSALKLKNLSSRLPFLPGHIYLWTSSFGKICILSKEAFLASAQAVNKNLQAQKSDKWLVSLPLFHVSGLSILARSFCGGFSSERLGFPWRAGGFQKALREKRISLCSLVPAQIYDLIRQGLKAPKTLRAVIVGGDRLSPWLYKKARELGWPVLISYGLTEAGSQVASAGLRSLSHRAFPKMRLLDHIQIKALRSKTKLKSESLLTAYYDIHRKTLYDPKDSKGWLECPDEIRLENSALTVKGRKDEEIKILGERVYLGKLSALVERLSLDFAGECFLAALPDKRQGFHLALIASHFGFLKALGLAQKFNKKALPFERIQNIYWVEEIKKSSRLKTRLAPIQKQLGF